VAFSQRHLALPLATADERLHGILIGYCDDILAKRGDTSPELRQRVEKTITKLLSRGEAQSRTVASELGMSTRTLARRLNEVGATFARVLDELRHDLAVTYLRDSAMDLSQIAFMLGYSELSAFSHAFKRWSGTSPGEWRTRNQH
jgi:AraC-like DNA-binding protein